MKQKQQFKPTELTSKPTNITKTKTKLNKDDIKKTLLDESEDIKKTLATMDKTTVKQAKQVASEMALLKEANQVQTNALQSNEEIASGIFLTICINCKCHMIIIIV